MKLIKGMIIGLFLLFCVTLCACEEKPKYTVVDKIEATVDYDTYTVASEIECLMTGNVSREYITLEFTVYQKNIFSKSTELYINGEKITENFTITGDDHKLVYKYLNPNYVEDPAKVLSEVRFNLDTLKYTGTSGNVDAYTIKVEVDKNYTYITTTLTMNDGYKFADRFDVYVNDKLVKEDYTINDERTVLIYKIKDPNWTPTY